MNVIGLNAFHGDSAACMVINGRIVAAAEEERFRRIKHWAGFPSRAIEFCLEASGLSLQDIDVVAINTDPTAARLKKMAYVVTGKGSFDLIKEKMSVRKKRKGIQEHLSDAFPGCVFNGDIDYVEHHLAHLASAYLVSPFENACVASIDGFGDFASTAWGYGNENHLQLERRVYFPHSLGVFYQAMTQFLGFFNYGDEYKVMGLAPYGQPSFLNEMREVVRKLPGGTFQLNLDYFRHHNSPIGHTWDGDAPVVERLYSSELEALLGPARDKGQPLDARHMDIAHSVQACYEEIFFHILNQLYQRHQNENLALAGGCGMNSVANGKVHLHTPFKNLYVQSAAGDAGGAIGAALVASQRRNASERFTMNHSYWGPSFDDVYMASLLKNKQQELRGKLCQVSLNLDQETLIDRVSDTLAEGKVVGWFQGAMEWGPRALGNRSILGDPRRADMKDILNLKIKRRESFRPFAPSVLREYVDDWFESDAEVPFMMKVFQIRQSQRSRVPAVCHVDGSGRLQTVTRVSNERYHALITAFYEKTTIPMLLNTSFNENEPVVCRPEEALDCFLRTNMDVLVLGSHLIMRGVD